MRVLYNCFQRYRRYGLAVAAIFIGISAHAQKEVQFSHFYHNQLFFNPATAGKEAQTRIGVVYRSQYAGYQPTNNLDKGGSPTSQLLTASIPFGKFGVGFYALNDKIGALAQQDVQLGASYKISLPRGSIAVGARAGLYRQSMDYDQLRPEDPNIDDPLFLNGVVSEIKPDLSIGLHYESDVFYAGASATHLTKPSYKLGSAEATNPLVTNYYINAGAFISLGYMLEVQPLVLAKMVPGAISAEGGALVTFDQRLFGGLTYRNQDAIAIIHAGAYLLEDRSLRISGAYDIVMRGDKAKTPTSFEIMLSYAFGAQKSTQKSIIRTPRFRF